MSENLETKIKELETKVEALAAKVEEQNSLIADLQKQLSLAVKTVSGETPDPQNALSKARNVLEKVVTDVYVREFNKPPRDLKMYEIINELAEQNKIDGRTRIIMHSIRSMANYGGAHGGYVITKDALYILDLIYDVTSWYMDKYSLSVSLKSNFEQPKPELIKTENTRSSLKQFWHEEEEAMKAEYKSEQAELSKKHNMEEITMRMFVGDPKADEMMKELTSDIEAMVGRIAGRVEAFIPNVQNKIKEELNKTK